MAARLVRVSRTETSLTLCIYDLSQSCDDYEEFRITCDGTTKYTSSCSVEGDGTRKSGNITFTGLTCDTSYLCSGAAYTDQWYSVSDATFTTDSCPPPDTPTGLEITSTGTYSMRWEWDSVSNADDYRWILSGGTSSSGTGLTNTYLSVSGLDPDTQYCLEVSACNDDGCSSYTSAVCGYTDDISRPSNWSWTSAETDAFNNKGEVDTVTYSRWNDFVDKVDDFRIYYNETHGTSISLNIEAYMSSGSRNLSDTRFNAVRNCINSMNSTTVPTVSNDDTVYGAYFITLKDDLNDIS